MLDRVICKKDDRLLGKQVHATHNARKPVKHRIRIADRVFKRMAENIFKNPRYTEKTKLQVWNGIIRALLTYGLNAVKLTQEENELVDKLTMKHMRVIFNPKTIGERNKRPFNNNAKLSDEQRRLKHKQNEERKYAELNVACQKMREHKQELTSCWIQYLRHAFIAKKYIRGEIDSKNIDILTANDEFQTNWNELWQEYERQQVY